MTSFSHGVQQARLREHKEAMLGHVKAVNLQYASLLAQHQAPQASCEAAEDAQAKLQYENQGLRQQLAVLAVEANMDFGH